LVEGSLTSPAPARLRLLSLPSTTSSGPGARLQHGSFQILTKRNALCITFVVPAKSLPRTRYGAGTQSTSHASISSRAGGIAFIYRRDLQPCSTCLATQESRSRGIHQTVRSAHAGVVRSSRHDGERHHTRKGHQGMETRLEDCTNRKVEP
jgi:hypothetical protein